MPESSADRLLAVVDPLPHALRLRATARTATRLAHAGQLDRLLDELDRRGPYERGLAALAAFAARHVGHLTARLTDPDPVVRRYALRAVRELAVPDEAVERAVLAAPTALRDGLIRSVLASGRTAPAESLVPALRERWGATEAARLLPVCSPGFVVRELPGLAHALTFSSSLGRRHPVAVLDEARRQLDALPYALRPAFWKRQACGLAAAAGREPVLALELLELHPIRHYGLTFPAPLFDRLADLAAADAERTARLLLASERTRHDPPPTAALARRLVTAPLAVVAELAHRHHADHRALLRSLPPNRRAALYDAVAAVPGPSRAWYSSDVLAELPERERQARARERLEQDDEDPAPLTHLPAAQARPELLARTRTADVWERAHAWELLVRQAAYSADPQTLHETLELLGRLRNEQDPVRRDVLNEVTTVPPALFDSTAAGPLERLTRDALSARDCSPATRAALSRLACRVLAEHAGTGARELLDWAVRALDATGAPVLDVPRGREQAVTAELRPLLERSAHSREAELLLALTDHLGRRTARAPLLAGLLEQVLRGGDDRAFTRAAAHLLNDPATRAHRVADALAIEPSAATLAPVQAVLTGVRTELLDTLLTPAPADPTADRDGTAPPRFGRTPLDVTFADRWLPRQQRTAAEELARTAADTTRRVEERAAALRSAARIPGHGPALLRRYAHADTVPADQDPTAARLAEVALAALPRIGRPADALPDLLAHAGDDRARVALYAASAVARFVPAAELAPALARIATDPAAKVTSRKQAVRLAAAHLPAARAAVILDDAYRAPEQHPDVRVTVVEQAAARLDTLQLWDVLVDAADESPGLRPALVASLRLHELPDALRPRAVELAARLATDDDPMIAAPALDHVVLWGRYAPHTVAALARPVTAIDHHGRWQEAAQAVRRLAGSDAPHPLGGCAPGSVMARTLSTLIEAVRAGEPPLEGRDHPARQRITALIGQYWGAGASPGAVRATTRAMAAMLLSEPALLALGAPLAVAAIEADSPTFGDELADLAAILADRPVLAASAATGLRSRLAAAKAPAPVAALAAVHRLVAVGTLSSGLLAGALVSSYGSSLGWPADWRTALDSLRRHPYPDVRDAALAVWTAPE